MKKKTFSFRNLSKKLTKKRGILYRAFSYHLLAIKHFNCYLKKVQSFNIRIEGGKNGRK